jgi:hypothetical protein
VKVWGCEDMDPRDRADAVLARAQQREGVVTPDNMTSPMDSANTQKIPRSVVRRIDSEPDPDTTTKLPSSMIEANDVRRSHLSESSPTTPMPQPGSANPDVTQPVSLPSSGNAEKEAEEQPADSDSGLVPTTTTTQEQTSLLSRRLEGL